MHDIVAAFEWLEYIKTHCSRSTFERETSINLTINNLLLAKSAISANHSAVDKTHKDNQKIIMSPDQTKYVDRVVPTISLADYENRIDQITAELVEAAENVGFFCVVDHGISRQEVDEIFEQSARFFALPEDVKAKVPFSSAHNSGWEKNSQVRPSTGAADKKESYQMQFCKNMEGKWLDDSDLPGFKESSLKFMWHVQEVSEKLMTCLARGLGFADDYFIKAHDVKRPDSQSVARLLHYFETPKDTSGEVWHRAGAHTDWDLLTLLFQKAGQSGLEVSGPCFDFWTWRGVADPCAYVQICPGREVSTSFVHGDTWTKIDPDPAANAIICNIGDLLMSWSDDRFKSTFHRVKAPQDPVNDYWGERYSIAFFNQPCRDTLIQGPLKKYPLITGEEFTRNAMNRNFRALEAKRLAEAVGVQRVAVEGGKVVAGVGA